MVGPIPPLVLQLCGSRDLLTSGAPICRCPQPFSRGKWCTVRVGGSGFWWIIADLIVTARWFPRSSVSPTWEDALRITKKNQAAQVPLRRIGNVPKVNPHPDHAAQNGLFFPPALTRFGNAWVCAGGLTLASMQPSYVAAKLQSPARGQS